MAKNARGYEIEHYPPVNPKRVEEERRTAAERAAKYGFTAEDAAKIARNTQPYDNVPQSVKELRLEAEVLRAKAEEYKQRIQLWDASREPVNIDMIRLAIEDLEVIATRFEAAANRKE